jgi:glycine hydroxymethyltransferase
MIFCRRVHEQAVKDAVFPGLQGGPHEHQIAGIATQLKEVMTPEFKLYIQQVKANAKALAATLVGHGYTMATGGTDNHLVLWDLRPTGVTGAKLEKLCDECCITLNKNSYADETLDEFRAKFKEQQTQLNPQKLEEESNEITITEPTPITV